MNRIVVISSVPRSGSSWVGQIFESSPDVCYRYQPLFSYKFKNALNQMSDREDYKNFFNKIYLSKDPFLLQTERKAEGLYPVFKKKNDPPILVFKMVRYHHLLEKMLKYFPNLKLICIIRHPCGVINSWIKTEKEFPKEAIPVEEWEYGRCRNTSPEENVWGFRAWERIAKLYIDLKKEYPLQVFIQRYEDLVEGVLVESKKIFNFCNIHISNQTVIFLKESQEKNIQDPYAVFKNKKVKEKWIDELDSEISSKIINLAKQVSLERFLI